MAAAKCLFLCVMSDPGAARLTVNGEQVCQHRTQRLNSNSTESPAGGRKRALQNTLEIFRPPSSLKKTSKTSDVFHRRSPPSRDRKAHRITSERDEEDEEEREEKFFKYEKILLLSSPPSLSVSFFSFFLLLSLRPSPVLLQDAGQSMRVSQKDEVITARSR